MTILDTVIILILFIFVGINLAMGLMHAIGSIIGLVMGVLVAKYYYIFAASYLLPIFGGRQTLAEIICFIIIFIITARIVGLVFHWGNKGLKIIPLVPTLDHIAGAILGFAEGVLVLGLILYFAHAYIPTEMSLGQAVAGSYLAGLLIIGAQILIPLIPEALKKAQEVLT